MKEKTEREKMLNNELYLATDQELTRMHFGARRLLHDFNCSLPDELARQKSIVANLFGKIGANFTIRPPFYCDYGCHIFAGNNLYIVISINFRMISQSRKERYLELNKYVFF